MCYTDELVTILTTSLDRKNSWIDLALHVDDTDIEGKLLKSTTVVINNWETDIKIMVGYQVNNSPQVNKILIDLNNSQSLLQISLIEYLTDLHVETKG